MLLGCIGDDFTGSSDLANTLAKGGMKVVQYGGIPATAAAADVEAGVIAAVSDLGRLLSVMRRIGEDDPARLRGELQSLAAPEAPYRFTALELLAALALREGDAATAREQLIKITDDPSAPSGSRSRAAELLASLPG